MSRRRKAREIALIDDVIRVLDGRTATQVSEGSHVNRFSLGWQLTRDRETIPYETVFVSAARPSEDDFGVLQCQGARRRDRQQIIACAR